MRKQTQLNARLSQGGQVWDQDMGKFSILKARHAKGHNDIDSTYTLRIDPSKDVHGHDALIGHAIAGKFGMRCQCTAPKCGHWQTEVRHVKRIKAREWMVRVYAWRAV